MAFGWSPAGGNGACILKFGIQIVYREAQKFALMGAAMVIDEKEVREHFRSSGHSGVVALIDYLANSRDEGHEIVKIGSTTIFGDPAKRPQVLSGDVIMSLGCLHFGTMSGNRLPIEEIARFDRR